MRSSGTDEYVFRFTLYVLAHRGMQNLDYNVPGGKLNRGISVTDTVEILQGKPLDEKEYKRAAVLGWCVEMVSLGSSEVFPHVYSKSHSCKRSSWYLTT